MRYDENHKQETRARVLKVAAKALREKGPDKLGVAEVMQAAGLTHGGFYAHFPSKEAFLTESLRHRDARLSRSIPTCRANRGNSARHSTRV